ncbi:MAG: FMN-binding protein [Eubacterium sp.]|nr:FMN-binding protein [Candidatus Colimonas fimequi]
MKNNNTFSEMVKPALVLVCICLAATLALAATHMVCQPLIEENAVKAANEARALVLPEGDSYTEYDGTLVEGVIDCYVADNGAGMTVTSAFKGFGGPVKVMTGIDANGAVTGVTVTEHAETPGLGTKDMTPEYLSQYNGITEASASHINGDAAIDAVTGATISANAIYLSVGEALAQFNECGGVK